MKKIVFAFFIASTILIGLYYNNFVAHIVVKDLNKTLEQKKEPTIGAPIIALDEENKTLDVQYKDVVLQIEELKKEKEAKDINKTVAVVDELNLSKLEYKSNIVSVQKIKKKELPKLAIIMDDVGFYEQAKNIKKIPFPITPSIFPPSEHYPNTKKIAEEFKYYMVHFPMEAFDYLNVREKAIKVEDTKEIINQKVKLVKENFPDVIAINNHTGSKFTCDLDAMDRFFRVLNQYNLEFIDSRTTSESKCLEAGKMNNREVLQRDIFLDNVVDVEHIKKQLKKAVRIAKKNGQAIAICHPNSSTFQVLMNAKDILIGVELVYINELL